MHGPYLLRPLQVDISVPTKVGGVYCLARAGRQVVYVGRAEHDLRDRIKSHWPDYQMFWYEPALTARDAFMNHCYAYHKHAANGLAQEDHPSAPTNMDARCPVCGK
jgi:hypothetical protein